MDYITTLIVPLAVAVFASTGFWNWLSNRKTSNKDIMKKLENVEKEINALGYTVDQNEAVNCRARLLRFNKELINHERHTQEEFDQCLEDCDKYERFCTDHPDFKNNKAVLSIANIKKQYQKCCEEGDFI